MADHDLAERLRLIVVTDQALARPRSVVEVVDAALGAGAQAVQLRNHGESSGQLLVVGQDLRSLTRARGAIFLVNDRLDLALALEADGVHVGPDDPPVVEIRRLAGPRFIIGRSADDPAVARKATDEGADYIGCGAVYPTSSKVDAGEVIGLGRLHEVARAVSVPVIAIGGITPDRVSEVAKTGAAGVAAIGTVMAADDVGDVVRGLLAPWRRFGSA